MSQGLRSGSNCTSMCLSSSFSSVGYLSRRIKGLLRPVVSTRIPGLLAPLVSMNSPRSSLGSRGKEGERRLQLGTQARALFYSQFLLKQNGLLYWLQLYNPRCAYNVKSIQSHSPLPQAYFYLACSLHGDLYKLSEVSREQAVRVAIAVPEPQRPV